MTDNVIDNLANYDNIGNDVTNSVAASNAFLFFFLRKFRFHLPPLEADAPLFQTQNIS